MVLLVVEDSECVARDEAALEAVAKARRAVLRSEPFAPPLGGKKLLGGRLFPFWRLELEETAWLRALGVAGCRGMGSTGGYWTGPLLATSQLAPPTLYPS